MSNKAMAVRIQGSEVDSLKAIMHNIDTAMTRCKRAGRIEWLNKLRVIDQEVRKAWESELNR